jgi:hypothetical protein
VDPLTLGAFVAFSTIIVLFSGVSVALGLLIVSTGFLMIFDGMRSLELLPEILFGKLDNFALLSIPMFIIMGSSIASTRAGADLYEALERWLTRVPGGLVRGGRVNRCGGNLGHSDPTLGYNDRLWHCHRNFDRASVLGGCDPRLDVGRAVHGVVALFHMEIGEP